MTAYEKRYPVFYEEPHEKSRIDHVIGVMSGKGGVGKSFVTTLTALAMERTGWNTGILDGDITGPSIPKAFGLSGGLSQHSGIPYARETNSGIQVVSTNLILDHETDPVLWKGPMVAQVLKQYWTEVVYENLDYLFVDMPPGTGDVPLTVFQMLPMDGVVIVTSPQGLVTMIVEKAIQMARMMNIPVLGLVENMSYFEAPDTGARYEVFGRSHVDEIAARYDVPVLAKLPMEPELAELFDDGRVEEADTTPFQPIVETILTATRGDN